MVFASQRWLGVRLDCLSALLTAATALASVIVSQDAGNYTCICNQQIDHFTVVYESEAEGDLVLIQTFLLYFVNQAILMLTNIFQEQFP